MRPHSSWLFILLAALSCACDPATDGSDAGGSDGTVGVEPGEQCPAQGCVTLETEQGTVRPQGFVRRLSKYEYENTVRDIFGVEAQTGAMPNDVATRGFSNTATGLVVSDQHVEAYRNAAQAIVLAPEFAQFVAAHATCQDLANDECRDSFLQSAGLVLFRRPLLEKELSDFGGLFEAVSLEAGDFAEATRLSVQSMLASPQFLYRLETEATGQVGVRTADGYELATRMSYALWSSTPDAALLEAAANGALADDAGIEAEAIRMLQDEKARRPLRAFIDDWALLFQLENLSVGGLTPEISAELRASAVSTYEDFLIDQQVPLTDIFNSQSAVLSGPVAEWYGLTPVSAEPTRYDLTPVEHRLGILTHPGVVAAITAQDVASMVGRGLFMLEHVLCGGIDPPPAGINTGDFTSHLGPDATQRDYAEDRAQQAGCGGCHGQVDPLAFGFEIFDAAGRVALTNEAGRMHRTDGELVTVEGSAPYETLEEYAALLATTPSVQNCLVQQNIQFAIGRPVDAEEQSSVQNIVSSASEQGNTYAALARTVVTHPIFKSIATE